MTKKRFTIKQQDDYFGVVDNNTDDKTCVVNGIRTEIEAEWLCDSMNKLNDENEQLKQQNRGLQGELQDKELGLSLWNAEDTILEEDKKQLQKENKELKKENEKLKSENQYLNSLKWNKDCINEISIGMQQRQSLERQNNKLVKENEQLKFDNFNLTKTVEYLRETVKEQCNKIDWADECGVRWNEEYHEWMGDME